MFSVLWCWIVVVGVALRLGIVSRLAPDLAPRDLLAIFAYGLAVDAAVAVCILAPFALLAAVASGAWLSRRGFRRVACTAFGAAIVFGGFVEYFFFEEFDARLNHIAIDYLLFPEEVAGNVWQSYPVPVYVGISLALGWLCAHLVERAVGERPIPARAWRQRLLGAGLVLFACAIALTCLRFVPAPTTLDRTGSEVASNGLVQLVHAFETASLDYESYYHTVAAAPPAEGLAGVKSRTFPPIKERSQPLDIVVIVGESFGSEFVGALHGRKSWAPSFERWASQGLLIANLVATGNRTVRGLEGVLCSFPPLPGDSIWKRDHSTGVATIAGVLKDHGYRTEFLYGGDGRFDGMESFALENGWDEFLDDSILGASSFPDEAFRTIWGVADESLYARLLERQRESSRDGRPLFATALTVSNHKPFLTPDSKVRGLRKEKLAETGLWGLGLVAISAFTWLRMKPHWGLGRSVTVLTIGWAAFLAYGWAEAQPRDSRESAVRYADRALGDYLDQARAEGILDHTLVLFVGDHGARVYGAEQIPAASYRIPAFLLAPDREFSGITISRLCSQVDLAPTLLSMAGIEHAAPFFGADLLHGDPEGPGRAYLIHNRDLGYLTDTTLTVLGLNRSTSFYARPDRSSDAFVPVVSSPALLEEADRAARVFQRASMAYEQGRYRVANAP